MSIDIILLAMVAVFVGLRLFSVLGQRSGHEQEPRMPRPVESPPKLTPVPQTVPDSAPSSEAEIDGLVAPAAAAGLRKIASADSSFEINGFLNGAQSAYRMILEAFWKGDRDDLAHLVDDDVRDSFFAAIDAREQEGHVLDNRLVLIERTQVENAEFRSGMARITLRFDADIAAVTHDKDGNLIAGSLSDAVQTHDVWTFARNVRDADPNWLLVETDEAS
ncbi:putative lipid-binding transport protein (Tim44 family) [Parasphingopyxis lamellibrachiae]|uniref:Putative lipid-binding transport protein (Tim44 family) n=2 Tax=Parasphingopyxis lamellibrachiae TaxID=680125 RepID=A0A3D9FCD4_9SPHN|nr:Tim44/TimA family putative adaptor protein [Parasphingopyxis lamellibrachiae]RED15328.1 putative lipid-binding transport protein (Tim44 family) [Parasphingopyxis lamellibrachiae]